MDNNTPEHNGQGKDSLLELPEILSKDTNELIAKLDDEPAGPIIETKWISGTDLIRAGVETIPCLVEPIIPKTGIMVFAGSSDTGKSTILRQLVNEIVIGSELFLGWKLSAQHKRALFVSTEDGKNAMQYLLKKQTADYSPDRLKNAYYSFVCEPSTIVDDCTTFVNQSPVDLIVVDCFSDAFGGKLMDTNEVRQYMNSFKELAEQCAVIFIHHTGKRTENFEPSKNNLLSGQGLEAKARLVIELRLDHVNPRLRHFCITKGNYLPRSYKSESFVLDFDESKFLFTSTEQRIPYEDLAKVQNDEGKAKYLRATELINQSKSYEEIAPLLGYNNKGSVSKLVKKGKERGWNEIN